MSWRVYSQARHTHGSVDQQPPWKARRGLWVGAADLNSDEAGGGVGRQRCGLEQQRSAILPESPSLAVIYSQLTTSRSPPHGFLLLSEGNKRNSLRSLRQVNIVHKAPRNGISANGSCRSLSLCGTHPCLLNCGEAQAPAAGKAAHLWAHLSDFHLSANLTKSSPCCERIETQSSRDQPCPTLVTPLLGEAYVSR